MTRTAVDMRARMLQEQSAVRIMSAFIAYAVEIGCEVGEGAFNDSIEATPAQGALLDAKWRELTEGYHGPN